MSKASRKITPLRGPLPCPECRKPSVRKYYPFCSERCKNLDLNRWFSGSYVIAGETVEDAEAPAKQTRDDNS